MVALGMEDLRERVHARAADTDEMDVLFVSQDRVIHKIHLISSKKFNINAVY
jgi:hypothetical protein